MTFLELTRGPLLEASLYILVIGVLWRLVGILALRRKPDYSEPRSRATWSGALRGIVKRMWPKRAFASRTLYSTVMGYAFHIGLAIVVFGFVPHILFIQELTGLSWPGLSNGAIYFWGAVTIAAMVALLIRRLTHPVLRHLSNFDDYFSWLVTLLPVVTGLWAVANVGARYETLLALHLLSVEVLFIWLPFGKLMHAFLVFLSRGTTGANFARKGAGI